MQAEWIGIPRADKLYIAYSVLEQESVALISSFFFYRDTNFQMEFSI